MKKLEISKLDAKEKMLILKAILEEGKKVYSDNTVFVLNQVLKTENKQIENNMGLFYKSQNKAKTVQDIIDSKNKKIAELKEEVKALNDTYEDKTAIVTYESYDLRSKYNTTAEEIAKEILQDVINDLCSKRLDKSLNK